MSKVLAKITARFDEREYVLDEETKQEDTVLKETAIECLTDSMSLMLEKLTVNDRQGILDQLYGKLYKTEQFKYFDEFRTSMLKLFLQIKQRQEEANNSTQQKEKDFEEHNNYVTELKNLELKFAK